jgi:hypothetical protein
MRGSTAARTSATSRVVRPGYHTASIWEVLDPSNLRYDTTQGFMEADSGSGPPTASGWIRTGRPPLGSEFSPAPNCFAWTDN